MPERGVDTALADHRADAAVRASVDDGHHLARGAVANALVLLASNFRGIFIFLIARLLGEAALGRFGLAFATTELLSKAGMLGFDNSIIPFLAPRVRDGDRAGAQRVFRRALAIAGVASTLLALVAVPVIAWLAVTRGLDAFSHGGVIMLLALPGIAVARIATGASRSVLAMSSEFYSRGLTETWVTTGVFVIAVALGFRDVAPALAVAVGATAAAGVAYVLAQRALEDRIEVRLKPDPTTISAPDPTTISAPDRTPGSAPDPTPAADMVRFSLPIAASSLLTVLVMQADVLLLGTFVNRAPGVTAESFGVFCAAAQIAGGLRKVRQVFDPIFAPVVATRFVSEHRASLRATVEGPGRWVLAAQLPAVAAMVLAAGPIMAIYGAGFRAGAPWLGLLAIAHGTNAFAGLVETLLMIERPGLNLLNASLTVLVQLTAGLLLIPRFGVTGAALAMCLGFAAQGVARFAEMRHVFGWSWPWSSLSRPLVAAAMALLPALAVRAPGGTWWELASGATFVAGYALAWLWLGPDPADRAVWRRLLER
ncbi:MAG TPA: polysaccharide biosynthesis C-terminal domain-containing protein [Vicinamibacterales bacterium]|nr:polysaccharide biosynthesis C-terminal domain-containing protein [Vicinamibacterales bacterium]